MLKPDDLDDDDPSMESERRLAVHDTGGDLVRVLRRLDRREPRTTEIILVTHRPAHLPGTLAHRVRTLRERTPDAAARRASSLANGGAVVVNTAGGPDHRAVTISASLIVKDEEQVIGACLEAIIPFVDEVVVYDTGSTDSTMTIARSAGAVVVEGYWDDHFGDARNRAAEHCTSEWIVSVDADEVAIGDPDALRRRLQGEVADVLPIAIVSTTWAGGTDGEEGIARRIARRGRLRWSGQLHEHLVAAEGTRDVTSSSDPAPLRLLHSGYQPTVVHERDKRNRNANLSRAALALLDENDPERPMAAANLGRSLILARCGDEGIEVLEEVRMSRADPTVVVGAGRAAVAFLVPARRLDEARAWLTVMAENGESRGNLDVQRAVVALAEGDAAAAEQALREAPSGAAARADKDCWGSPFDIGSTTGPWAAVELAQGRPDEALARLRRQMDTAPDRVDIAQLLTVLDSASTPWEEVAASAPDHFLDRSVRVVVVLGGPEGVERGLRWCQAFTATHPGDHRPLVAGCVLAARGDLAAALTWSIAAREAGQPGLCPVRAGAGDLARPVHERALWWALLADSFGETDAQARFTETMAEVAPGDLESLCSSLDHLAPSLTRTSVDVP